MEDLVVVANTHLQAYLVLPTKDSRKNECSMLSWKIIPWEWIPTLPQATASCDSFFSYFTSIVEGCDKNFRSWHVIIIPSQIPPQKGLALVSFAAFQVLQLGLAPEHPQQFLEQ
jgi:hypothetical protein